MRRIDLSGKRFGMLTAISHGIPYIKPSGQTISTWLCKCDCGKEITVRTESLRNGHTTSCGCKRGYSPLPGDKYGNLIVISHQPNSRVLCRCVCGNQVLVDVSNLNNGNTRSCGCLQRKRASESCLKSLIGLRFGKLNIVERVANNRYGHVQYRCICDCGGQIITEGERLRQGRVQSCGCIKSVGEMKVNYWLRSHGIKFEAQFSHDKIFLSSGRRPIFDFAIFDNSENLLFLIEYQGRQHYGYSGYGWDNATNHIKTANRDVEKRNECFRLGIPLYEINETDLDSLDDMLNSIVSHYPNIGMEELQDDVNVTQREVLL